MRQLGVWARAVRSTHGPKAAVGLFSTRKSRQRPGMHAAPPAKYVF
jgi:hypothetical protein